VLIAENITKKFPGVIALDNVSLELHEGKVNAIIGENGAGKSTLMKILSGVYSEFEGRIIYKGKPIHFSNPKEAEKAGIAIIHQELNLIPDLTIAENIFLGRELTTSFGLLDKKKMRTATQQLLDKLKLATPPDTIIASLKLGEQQVVEIAKALLTNAELIIMDEPTSAISESEVEILFTIINELKQENKTIVYISHKLDELFKIADRFIVLRDGKMIEQGDMQGITHDDIIKKMVGRNITAIDKQAISEGKPSSVRKYFP
jgi:ribose transport system ATP-binding protein